MKVIYSNDSVSITGELGHCETMDELLNELESRVILDDVASKFPNDWEFIMGNEGCAKFFSLGSAQVCESGWTTTMVITDRGSTLTIKGLS